MRREFGRALARSQVTADGFTFEFGVLRTYFYVTPGYFGKPDIESVSFFGINFNFQHYEEDDRFVILQERNGVMQEYSISNLYYRRDNADIALLAAQEEWLREREEEIEELRSRLNG